jgi:spore coat protein U-like protein
MPVTTRLRHALSTLAAVLAWLALSFAAPAHAQSCSASFSGLSFGSVDVLGGVSASSAGTVNLTCTGMVKNSSVRLCVGLGPGSVPPASGIRQMAAGTNYLAFELYADSSHGTAWNQINTRAFDISAAGTTSASTTANVYGQIFANQRSAPPGAYANSINPTVRFLPYQGGLAPSCSAVTALASTSPLPVSATIVPNCNVAVTDLNFGTHGAGDFQQPIDGQSTITVACTQGTSYTIALDGGKASAADPTQRQMTNANGNIAYGLYRDSGRQQPWGSTSGGNTLAGSGSPAGTTSAVYGRVPPLRVLPAPGVYQDMVIVTVSFM